MLLHLAHLLAAVRFPFLRERLADRPSASCASAPRDPLFLLLRRGLVLLLQLLDPGRGLGQRLPSFGFDRGHLLVEASLYHEQFHASAHDEAESRHLPVQVLGNSFEGPPVGLLAELTRRQRLPRLPRHAAESRRRVKCEIFDDSLTWLSGKIHHGYHIQALTVLLFSLPPRRLPAPSPVARSPTSHAPPEDRRPSSCLV